MSERMKGRWFQAGVPVRAGVQQLVGCEGVKINVYCWSWDVQSVLALYFPEYCIIF